MHLTTYPYQDLTTNQISTGIRSVDHAIETLGAPKGNPISDVLAEKGLARLAEGLLRSHKNPTDVQGRQEAQLGSWMASMAMAR